MDLIFAAHLNGCVKTGAWQFLAFLKHLLFSWESGGHRVVNPFGGCVFVLIFSRSRRQVTFNLNLIDMHLLHLVPAHSKGVLFMWSHTLWSESAIDLVLNGGWLWRFNLLLIIPVIVESSACMEKRPAATPIKLYVKS